MGRDNTRYEPVAGIVTTSGVVGASDQVWHFRQPEAAGGLPVYVRPCWVSNKHGTISIYVKVNEIDASDTDHHIIIAPGQTRDVSEGGQVNVNFVSVYIAATAAYTDVQVHGMKA